MNLFRSSLIGGYNREDVLSYIQQIEEETDRLHAELKKYENDARRLEEAEKNAEAIIADAKKQAEETLSSAKSEAEETIAGAKEQADKYVTEAARQAEDIRENAKRQAELLTENTKREIEDRKKSAYEELENELDKRAVAYFIRKYRFAECIKSIDEAWEKLGEARACLGAVGEYAEKQQADDEISGAKTLQNAAECAADKNEKDSVNFAKKLH